MTWLPVAVAGLLGLGFGYAADRLAARWPEHEDGSNRARDWRTPIVGIVGGLAFAATAARFGADLRELGVVFPYVAVLVVLFAIDLDQRLLPNVLTYPLVVYAVVVYAVGASPFIAGGSDLVWAVAAAVLIPVGLFALAIPFASDAIGEGDLKLLFAFGLFGGAMNLVYSLIAGSFAAGIVVSVLVFVRVMTLKTYFPYGPFLIGGILWSILVISRP